MHITGLIEDEDCQNLQCCWSQDELEGELGPNAQWWRIDEINGVVYTYAYKGTEYSDIEGRYVWADF